ncbi:MAG: class I SAM-dependent methyltransferase [Desulfobacula sp.]|nr:class I SAM-dependent methyltransferase [Desulfobacula sp.]
MVWEQSKSAKRRLNIGAFHTNYFVGNGIDIGGKPDPLGQYAGVFAKMTGVQTWDLADGDAQYMEGVKDNLYDFLHSSHCLEHMVDPKTAFENWIRIVKPGGHIVVTIPDEDLYEMGVFPSRFNPDHKWTMTICKNQSWSGKSINILDFLKSFCDEIKIIKIELVEDFFRPYLVEQGIDQTATPVAECCIEFIVRKL